jgi:hypothetical protein
MSDSDSPVVVPEASQEPPSATRKVERTQNFESIAYSVDSLERLLNTRKRSGSCAKYWRLLSVKRIPVTEKDGERAIRFERIVLECNECGYQHGGKAVAPANFARSHFDNHSKVNARCKRALGIGTSNIHSVIVTSLRAHSCTLPLMLCVADVIAERLSDGSGQGEDSCRGWR